MKKVLAIVLALTLALVLAVPVVAGAVTTTVTMSAGGDPPLIKCKWETPDDCDMYYPNYEDCGVFACEPGTQVKPNPGYVDVSSGELVIGEKEVKFWAVVTHDLGMGYVNGVYADVYHPNVLKQLNLSGDSDPSGEWCGSFKFQVTMPVYKENNNDAAILAFQEAYDHGLVTFNTAWLSAMGFTEAQAVADIIDELEQGLAEVFQGADVFHNHQPCGNYSVEIMADNTQGLFCDPLANVLEICCLDSFLFDLTNLDYGEVAINIEKPVGGDDIFGGPPANKPTVWNNGNTYIHMNVAQDDMGFGQSSGVWNVHYAARLGNESQGTKMTYDPDDSPSILPELLVMCTPTKMDFFILVDKATQPSYGGTLTLGCEHVDFIVCCE